MIITTINTTQNIVILTVHGGWSQGSPSICMGTRFLVLMVTVWHWANLRPDDLIPALTWPTWSEPSRPTTSNSLSPIATKRNRKKNQVNGRITYPLHAFTGGLNCPNVLNCLLHLIFGTRKACFSFNNSKPLNGIWIIVKWQEAAE